MQKFKLRKEVRQFFPGKEKDILSLDQWESKTIPEEILELMPKVYVKFGRDEVTISGTKSTSLSSCSGQEKEGRFEFTIIFSDMDFKEYHSVNVAEIMDEIQSVLDRKFNI